MANRRATQADVAALAGVSPTAVSLVLAGRTGTRLSDTVQSRVHAAAAELGYRPNLTARALSTQRSHAIGLVSDQASVSPEASALIRGALRGARAHRMTVLTAETEGDPEIQREATEALVDRGVDGLIFVASRSRVITLPEAAMRTRLVLLNARIAEDRLAVLPDEHNGARSLVDLLAQAGHRDAVAVIGAGAPELEPDVTFTVKRRLEGLWEGFAAHGITPFATVPEAEWELSTGYDGMRALLARETRPKVVICLNDRLAFGASRAIHDAGLRIPEDVSIASFDDDVIAEYVQPQLTTVSLPYVRMGELAVELLMNDDSAPGEHLVDMPVHVRRSVRGLAPTEQG
ncbi:substrate-binding domain-containing protein [Galbitalea soli]|uniref:LacI family transcriptional regulator n=1 Tax=Galbitalea soli TaxID=1268042 RepID=A0A7C9TUB0_9MICO|nr:LacI family transcriptional regulator [Galbitalea soli]NYJ31741.1 LacI family transcriptional regulator [Galbitalea soli]